MRRLIDSALAESWDPYRDLPWETQVDLTRSGQSSTLLAQLPEFQALSEAKKQQYTLREGIYHMSNLLAGEHQGVRLAAQILLGCPNGPNDSMDWSYFTSTILSDERNHVLALSRYLDEKMGLCFAPHPRIEGVLKALLDEKAYAIKLFIGQVVLEWTATSLLASMLAKQPEPLFHQILKKIIRDEGRHLLFNRVVFSKLDARDIGAHNRATEDLLFESIVACVSSLCAIPVWQEFGFSKASCAHYALQEMETKGVIRFYRDILPKELKRCHFYSDRLMDLLKNELPKQVVKDHWSFEPTTHTRSTEVHGVSDAKKEEAA